MNEQSIIPSIVLKTLDRKPEMISQNNIDHVEVNTYASRGKRTLLHGSGGIQREWFSVKGGVGETKKINAHDTPNYEIMYNPQRSEWLKTLPILTREQRAAIPDHLNQLQQQLQIGVTIQKRAMELADLGNLASTLRLETITLPDNTQQLAFISPHFGDSLEYVFIQTLDGKRKPEKIKPTILREDVKKWAQRIYQTTFHDAIALYLHHGYWTQDPNPGNILLHRRQQGNSNEIFPFLIDFTNSRQKIDVPTQKPSETIDAYRNRLRNHYTQHIDELTGIFRAKCNTWFIPFRVSDELRSDITEEIERLVAAA